jgi:hypothetical protein
MEVSFSFPPSERHLPTGLRETEHQGGKVAGVPERSISGTSAETRSVASVAASIASTIERGRSGKK